MLEYCLLGTESYRTLISFDDLIYEKSRCAKVLAEVWDGLVIVLAFNLIALPMALACENVWSGVWGCRSFFDPSGSK